MRKTQLQLQEERRALKQMDQSGIVRGVSGVIHTRAVESSLRCSKAK